MRERRGVKGCRSKLPPLQHRLCHRPAIYMLQLAAHRQAARDARNNSPT